jgi:site-specific recombinase XerD
VDLHSRRAFIRPATSKTRQGRTVFFSESTGGMMNRLLEVRPEEWDNETPVFCTSYGDRWNTHAWTIQLRRYSEKAGLKRFSAYDLRHQHALEALRNGMDVFSLQRGMGHSTLSMTEKYHTLPCRTTICGEPMKRLPR